MMRVVLLGLVALTVVVSAEDKSFESFMLEHEKFYSTIEEFNYRKLVYLSNLAYINKHNQLAANGSRSFTLRVNKYADMTSAEFAERMNGFRYQPDAATFNKKYSHKSRKDQLPGTVDWRTKGYVTAVKDQGNCGSCWSFSATGSLEGQHYNVTKRLVSLSEQNLVDCSSKFGNKGCQGGLANWAFHYVISNGGIDTEASYPYEAKNDKCRFTKANIGSNCVGIREIKSRDEQALQSASAEVGPISVGIDATHKSFHLYGSGVYDEPDCNSTKLDHAVLVVGYGVQDGLDYWLVKNSWGQTWGEAGYVKMSRNKNNQCGIATDASFPIVTA